MVLTISQTADILNKSYWQTHKHFQRGNFKTAQRIGWVWVVDALEIMEIKEKLATKNKKRITKKLLND